MGRFFNDKIALWIDTRSTTDKTLHGSSRAVKKSGIMLQIEKASVISLEDALAHLNVTNPSGFLTIEK